MDIPKPGFEIGPCEEMLFVGSCFADNIGARFLEEKFRAIVNPFGVMYNPASILHTIERMIQGDGSFVTSSAGNVTKEPSPCINVTPSITFLTLGTNHVYRLKETGEIVDNCQKRPQSLFTEEELTVDECVDYLRQTVALLRQMNPEMNIVLTVSPIRYRKYGYHGSRLSKATLLLAIDKLMKVLPLNRGSQRRSEPLQNHNLDQTTPNPSYSGGELGPCSGGEVVYFPAYELINDDLRDYRFYKPDMLHPSDQAVEYIWQRLSEVYLSVEAKAFLKEWAPLKAVLHHKPFDPQSADYKALMDKTMLKIAELQKKYPTFAP